MPRIQKKDLQQDFIEGKDVFRYEAEGKYVKVTYYVPKEIVDGKMPSFIGAASASALVRSAFSFRFASSVRRAHRASPLALRSDENQAWFQIDKNSR